MTDANRRIVVVCGPTAVGKTKYAIELAKRLDGEIVSADSMQLYKFMDIGSAKPTADEQAQVKHYLVDEIDPRTPFSVASYQKLAKEAIAGIFAKGKVPVVSGGTGLYINSLIYDMDFSAPPSTDSEYRKNLEALAAEKGNEYLHAMLRELDPESADRIHPNNVKKVIRAIEVVKVGGKGIRPFESSFVPTSDYGYRLIGLNRRREELYRRIDMRVDVLMETGLVDEIRSLMEMGLTEDDISMKGIGYKEIIGYLCGNYSMEYAVELVKRNTRRYAKRQLTWLRRYEDMNWFDLSEYDDDARLLSDMLAIAAPQE